MIGLNPSFSLIVETENLINADIAGLSRSLASLVNQTLSPEKAQEVLLLDSGDTPPQLLTQLGDRYPWIKVHTVPDTASYYQAKMLGAEIATGEIVVYCDSDCLYEATWLENLLRPFSQNPDIAIVAGETMTRGVGIYGTAMVLAYIFPPFSQTTDLTPEKQYFLNNAAFRREFLLQHPIPTQLPLYRGNCAIHAANLPQNSIWRQPQARATHAPPASLSHFFWRFLLIGHDYYWQKQINREKRVTATEPSGFGQKLQIFRERLRDAIAWDFRHLIFLPFALPIALTAALLVALGYFFTVARPKTLLNTYQNWLEQS
ncbi:MAG: glycosyltransferase family A protein [Jaaginema sp. PMC 1079.18]|nr:glycosyltransferase family A protein [Jaaginema sp. PMC 1080.18]MEC4851209.1 glycosyltransferase family A protein [Jaaginema sp. PMC 1079.18]MEC4865686.1 glycosyltransferase family A protein [Jaaginema sp. PMC 1078.18]